MEPDGPPDTKSRKRTEGAAKAVQAMYGNSCSANRVDPDPMYSTSFGNELHRTSDTPLFKRGCPGSQRRCGAQVVYPTLGNALTNSRWWFTSHRRSLYSDEDHLQLATSSALLDRGDEFKEDDFEDSDFIRRIRQKLLEELPVCCPLLPEGHRDKIRRKQDV